jgi:hypothetical protein
VAALSSVIGEPLIWINALSRAAAVRLLNTELNHSTGVEKDQTDVKTSCSDARRAMPIRRVRSATTTGSCSVVCNVFIGSVWVASLTWWKLPMAVISSGDVIGLCHQIKNLLARGDMQRLPAVNFA